MKESQFQFIVKNRLEDIFPGCIILKNDPTYIQGFPDLLVLWNNKWAALECKRSEGSSRRPNQEYYIHRLDDMSFASFIYPENMEEVLDDLERSFKRYS